MTEQAVQQKAVNAFVFRDKTTGISIDVAFVGEDAILDIISEIEAYHTPGSRLIELAGELQKGLDNISGERRGRVDFERHMARLAPTPLAATANGTHALALVGRSSSSDARTVHAYDDGHRTLCDRSDAHIVTGASRYIPDAEYTFEQYVEGWAVRLVNTEERYLMQRYAKPCARCEAQMDLIPLDEIERLAAEAERDIVTEIERATQSAEDFAERIGGGVVTTLADIRIPRRLKARPLFHGMVVPITATIDARGVPDFAVINDAVARRLIAEKGCALCGTRIRGRFAFIGGGNAVGNRLFRDGPMHDECARYAFAVCPFVTGRHREYREASDRPHALDVIAQGPVPPRPERMGLMLTDHYDVLPGGLVHAGEPVEPVEWIA